MRKLEHVTRITFSGILLLVLSLALVGCASPALNPRQPVSEAEVLSGVRQLTTGFDHATEASISADGRWVVFQPRSTKTNGQANGLCVAPIQLDGDQITGLGRPVNITRAQQATGGAFSPNGVSLVFSALPPKGHAPVLFRADGWQQAVESADANNSIDLAQNRISDEGAVGATWSVDGKQIFFTRRASDSKDSDVYVTNADGSNTFQLTTKPGYEGGARQSPDGRRLIYRANRDENESTQIYIADIVSTGGTVTGLKREKQLTFDGNANWNGSWYPNGRFIVYASYDPSTKRSDLWMMKSDGKLKTRLTHAGQYDRPVFSPDGRYLLWTGVSKTDGSTQVFVAKFKLPAGL